jgi:hypothetical protein
MKRPAVACETKNSANDARNDLSSDRAKLVLAELPACEKRNRLTYRHIGSAKGLDTGYKVMPRRASALCSAGIGLVNTMSRWCGVIAVTTLLRTKVARLAASESCAPAAHPRFAPWSAW